MLAVWRSGNKPKNTHTNTHTSSIVTFLKAFKGRISPQLSTSDTVGSVLVFFFHSCLFLALFFRVLPSLPRPYRCDQS